MWTRSRLPGLLGRRSQKDQGDEQYQDPPPVFTYNAKDPRTGDVTYGGYSDEIVVDQHFVLHIPDGLPLEKAAPLLWARAHRHQAGQGPRR